MKTKLSVVLNVLSIVTMFAFLLPPFISLVQAADPTPNIGTELTTKILEQPLLGEYISAEVTIKNTGIDRAYKATIETTLPTGITYVESLKPDARIDNGHFADYSLIQPQIVGNTLVWNNIADLLANESYTVAFKLKLAGEPTFYIEDVLSIDFKGQLYSDPLSPTPIEQTTTLLATVQGVRVDTSGSGEVVTGTDETLLQEKTIEVKNNPVRDSNEYDPKICEVEGIICDSVSEDDHPRPQDDQQPQNCDEYPEVCEEYKQPVKITETLDKGIEYIPNSETVTTTNPDTNLIENVEHEFNVTNDIATGNTVLEWLIKKLTKANYKNPLAISYLFGIPYKELDENENVIEDDAQYNAKTEVDANYKTRDNDNLNVNLSQDSTVVAKYIKIWKNLTPSPSPAGEGGRRPGEVAPGDEITYTLNIQTSEYYNFSNLVVEDILPDGFSFVSSSLIPDSTIINADGTTTVTWTIDTINALDNYSFAYVAKVNETYNDETNVVSNDSFQNNANVEGNWNDNVDTSRTGNEDDSASTAVTTATPTISIDVWNNRLQAWQKQINANKDYDVKIRATIDFPTNVPTQSAILKNYIPPYTVFSGQFSVISEGTFEKDPQIVVDCVTNAPISDSLNDLSQVGMCINIGDVSESSTLILIYVVHVNVDAELSNNDILRNLTRLHYVNHDENTFVELDQGSIRILDPRAQISLNNGAFFTKSDLVQKWSRIVVPDMSLDNEVRFVYCNKIVDCFLPIDPLSENVKITPWTSRDNLEQTDLDYVINGTLTGEKNICIQARDEKGNESGLTCDRIVLDTTAPTGAITIVPKEQNSNDPNSNNYTYNPIVDLQINYSDPKLADGLDGSGVQKIYVSKDGKDWTEYPAASDNSLLITDYSFGDDILGYVSVFTKFTDKIGNESKTFSDQILILDPNGTQLNTYGILYHPATSYQQSSVSNNTFSLENVPTTYVATSNFKLMLDAENTGSLVWYPATDTSVPNPVNISYHWINAITGQIVTLDGNRGQLQNVVSYGQRDNDINLQVNTPTLPGTYILQIDAIQEGVTWFSTKGNYSPSFLINITENPNNQTPANPTELPDYTREDDFGLGPVEGQSQGLPVGATTEDVLGATTPSVCSSETETIMYAAPNESYDVITTLPSGLTLTIVSKASPQPSPSGEGGQGPGEVWLQIVLTDGRIGWIKSGTTPSCDISNVPLIGNLSLAYNEAHICSSRTVEIRFNHSWSSSVLATLPLGTRLYVLQSFPEPTGGNWINVVTIDGITGWVFDNFVCEGFEDNPTYNLNDEIPFQRPYTSPQPSPEGEGATYDVPITSDFGERNGTFHTGVDYGLYCGTEIQAAVDGVVTEIGTNGVVLGNESTPSTPANYVKIRHTSPQPSPEGEGASYESWYWHLDTVYVQVGAEVTKGMPIGTSGNTGYVRGNSNVPVEEQGCHLHFEIRKINTDGSEYPIDPELFIEYGDFTSPVIKELGEDLGYQWGEGQAYPKAPTYANNYIFRDDTAQSCSRWYIDKTGLGCIDDNWGFYQRECTSYVSWRINYELNQNNYFTNGMIGPNDIDTGHVFGDAGNWDDHAIEIGYDVGTEARAGAIAVWDSGHVAYVESVNADGTANISEYNWGTVAPDYLPDGRYNYRIAVTADHYIYIINNKVKLSSPQVSAQVSPTINFLELVWEKFTANSTLLSQNVSASKYHLKLYDNKANTIIWDGVLSSSNLTEYSESGKTLLKYALDMNLLGNRVDLYGKEIKWEVNACSVRENKDAIDTDISCSSSPLDKILGGRFWTLPSSRTFTFIKPNIDLGISVNANPNNVLYSQQFAVTQTINNNSNIDALNVNTVIDLPYEFDLVKYSSSNGWNCNKNTSYKIVCTISKLSANSQSAITFTWIGTQPINKVFNIYAQVVPTETDTNSTNNIASVSLTLTYIINPPPPVQVPKGVYRFFNKVNGEHFYTISDSEKTSLMANPSLWSLEGVSFNAYELVSGSCQVSGTVPIYRFWKKADNTHMFTSDESERATMLTLPAWTDEGKMFCVFPNSGSGRKPVYRFFNKNTGLHLLTSDESEKATVMALADWQYEGIKFYVL